MQGVLLDEDRRHVADVAVLVGEARQVGAVGVVALGRILVVVQADAFMDHVPEAFQRLVHRLAHDLVHPGAARR